MSPPSKISQSTIQNDFGTLQSAFAVPAPSGAPTLFLAAFNIRINGSNRIFTLPANGTWAQVGADHRDFFDTGLVAASHLIAIGIPPNPQPPEYTFSLGSAQLDKVVGGIYAISGANLSLSPHKYDFVNGTSNFDSSKNTVSVTTTIPDCLILDLLAYTANATDFNFASGITKEWFVKTAAATHRQHLLGSRVQASAGAPTVIAINKTGASNTSTYQIVQIAIAPVPIPATIAINGNVATMAISAAVDPLAATVVAGAGSGSASVLASVDALDASLIAIASTGVAGIVAFGGIAATIAINGNVATMAMAAAVDPLAATVVAGAGGGAFQALASVDALEVVAQLVGAVATASINAALVINPGTGQWISLGLVYPVVSAWHRFPGASSGGESFRIRFGNLGVSQVFWRSYGVLRSVWVGADGEMVEADGVRIYPSVEVQVLRLPVAADLLGAGYTQRYFEIKKFFRYRNPYAGEPNWSVTMEDLA